MVSPIVGMSAGFRHEFLTYSIMSQTETEIRLAGEYCFSSVLQHVIRYF